MCSDAEALSAMSTNIDCLRAREVSATFTDASPDSAIMITRTTSDRLRIEKAGTTANEWEER
jgi:hypothetical protein